MLFDEGDAALLKKWVVKRLEDISDADSDVLADYVLALLRHEQGEEEVKQLCIEQLLDFLREHTITFVDDLFTALRTKSFRSVNSTLSGTTLNVSPPPPPVSVTTTQDSGVKLPIAEQSQQQNLPTEQQPPTQTATGNQHRQYSPTQTRFNNNDRAIDRSNGKKRPYLDRDREGGREGDSQHTGGQGGNRGFKAPRRGNERGGRWGDRGTGRGGYMGQQISGPPALNSPAAPLPFAAGIMPGLPAPPVPPPGFPWAEDPMATFLAVQAAAGWAGMPGFPPPHQAGSPTTATHSKPRKPVEKKVGERCKDYDEKGYCMQGDMCPYEHGLDHIVIPGQEQSSLDEYDPNNAQIFPMVAPTDNGTSAPSERGRPIARGVGRGQRGSIRGGRGGRSEISHTGPSFDRSNTTLVVEYIPEDKLDETSIREFFGTFGNIKEVDVQQHKKLATVKFERWDGAKKAYDSPEPIFNNRFVKVFWHKPSMSQTPTAATPSSAAPARGGGHAGSPPATAQKANGRPASPVPQLSKFSDETEDIDMEEFNRKQQERQKVFEDRMAKKKAHEEAMKELEKKKEELLMMEREQKALLMEKLAKKKATLVTKQGQATASISPPATNPATPTARQGTSPEPNGASVPSGAAASATKGADPETESLRAQLEALEAEAKSLGIDHFGEDASYRGRGRGRVSRGATRGRAGYYNPYYAPYAAPSPFRGRGGFPVRGRGGPASMRLDNRTKKVAVKGVNGGDGDEALRQYLLQIGEFESISPHPDPSSHANTQVISFKDRATAEKFILGGRTIPGIGTVELSWVHTGGAQVSASAGGNASHHQEKKEERDLEDKNGGHTAQQHLVDHHRVVEDYDVADDDEGRWLAE